MKQKFSFVDEECLYWHKKDGANTSSGVIYGTISLAHSSYLKLYCHILFKYIHS